MLREHERPSLQHVCVCRVYMMVRCVHDAGHELSWYYLVEQLVVHCNDIRSRSLVKLPCVFRLFEDVSPEFDDVVRPFLPKYAWVFVLHGDEGIAFLACGR